MYPIRLCALKNIFFRSRKTARAASAKIDHFGLREQSIGSSGA
jgi:hypothetical protein